MGKYVAIGWHIRRTGTITKFMNADMDVKMYVSWIGDRYKLNQSLYSPKQSSRIWNEKLRRELEKL